MSHATPIQPGKPETTDWKNQAFDLTRGIAVYSNSKLVAGLARVIAKHPHAEVGVAFNHKQLASKMWARDSLLASLGGKFQRVWILGGWYGVLAAMLLDDPRFEIETIDSIDIDPAVEEVCRTLAGDVGDRFCALTNDMYALDYAAGRPDLVINTSCEHIIDLKAWLQLLPRSTAVLLQSNNYVSEPTHINCMNSLAEFADEAGLDRTGFFRRTANEKLYPLYADWPGLTLYAVSYQRSSLFCAFQIDAVRQGGRFSDGNLHRAAQLGCAKLIFEQDMCQSEFFQPQSP